MSQNTKTFKDDIAAAERKVLIVSWLGIVSAISVIGYSVLAI